MDFAQIKKHLLKTTTLTGSFAKAADTDKNNSITIMDLAQIKKHLLKTSNISQS